MIRYAILGSGWRSEFYLRIATLMPKRFSVSAICIRNKEKQSYFFKKYTVKIVNTVDELLGLDYDFVVNCVDKASICDTITLLCKKGVPVLTETPINNLPEDYNDIWKVQLAEQFHFLPQNQAYKTIIDSGLLGDVHQVQISCCHEYHAASLIRFFLDTKDEIPKISTFSFDDNVYKYNSRQGLEKPNLVTSKQKISLLSFSGKTAVYDFSGEQYFSDIRASRICIRGTNGEVVNNKCTYIKDGLPITFSLERVQTGINENLDGFSLVGITGNGSYLYINPFENARLSDEDIAIATCLENMYQYLKTSKAFYSLNEGIIDTTISNKF